MRKALPWLLWLWISLVIVGAFLYAPLAGGFKGHSSRILFFHVPMAWVATIAFMAAGVYSILYLRGRQERHDRAAAAAVELGLVFCILATITGAMWARTMWGAFWNWDPRQVSIAGTLVFYAAYLTLRGSVTDPERRGRLAAVYAVVGLAVTPFFIFVIPRITFSLHPEDSIIDAQGQRTMEGAIFHVFMAANLGFTALYFWVHNLICRLRALEQQRAAF